MRLIASPRPDGNAGADPAPDSDDAARKRAIAHALRTEIHWLMPTDRTVSLTVDGDDIAVAFGPPRTGGRSACSAPSCSTSAAGPTPPGTPASPPPAAPAAPDAGAA